MSANSAQIKTTSKTNFHQKTTKHTLQRLLLTIYLAFVFGSHSTSKPSSFMFAHAQSRTFAHRSGQCKFSQIDRCFFDQPLFSQKLLIQLNDCRNQLKANKIKLRANSPDSRLNKADSRFCIIYSRLALHCKPFV